MAKVDLLLLDKYISDKLITKQQHPSAALFIYNYTPSCQYGRNWDDVTLMCRGLITDAEGNIIARPFRKFFNLEEHQGSVPDEPFTVHEKLDGSLGILYWVKGMPFLATRGSFTSDQAQEGTNILLEKYGEYLSHLSPAHTYLFEIIYPQNRIVVDYKDRRDVVMLAKIHTDSGKEVPIKPYGDRFSIAKRYDGIKDIASLRELENGNDEGFVVTFAGGLKLKLKFSEYVRLHRLLTQVSSKTIWEALKNDIALDELIERVPDEFYHFVENTIGDLQAKRLAIVDKAMADFENVPQSTRAEKANYILKQQYPQLLFAMLDGKPIDDMTWKLVKPTYEKPFKKDIDA